MCTQSIIACYQCDLIQYEVKLLEGEKALCSRCNAMLYRNTPPHRNQEIAFTASAIVMLLIANLFPIATIVVQGKVIDATLFSIIQMLVIQQQNLIALLLFVTLFLAPILEVFAMAYMLTQLEKGWPTHNIAHMYKLHLTAKTWILVDVFMLGILVALVKLMPIMIVKVGIAVWAFAGLIILFTLSAQVFDAKKVWSKIDFQ